MARERHSVRVSKRRGRHECIDDEARIRVTEVTRGSGAGLMAGNEARLQRKRHSAVFSTPRYHIGWAAIRPPCGCTDDEGRPPAGIRPPTLDRES